MKTLLCFLLLTCSAIGQPYFIESQKPLDLDRFWVGATGDSAFYNINGKMYARSDRQPSDTTIIDDGLNGSYTYTFIDSLPDVIFPLFTFKPETIWIRSKQPLQFKIDTVRIDTVKWVSERKEFDVSCDEYSREIEIPLGTHSCWGYHPIDKWVHTPICIYTTDTTFYLSPEQVKLLEGVK